MANCRERQCQEVKEERLRACLDRDCLLELVLVGQWYQEATPILAKRKNE